MEDFDLGEVLGRISKRGELERESPITKGVRELIEEINKEVLEGKGEFSVSEAGGYPGEVDFTLSWEGAHTKKIERKTKGGFIFLLDPFHLNIKPFQDEESGSMRFKVTAKYEGSIDDPDIELGTTTKMDVTELEPLIQGQINNIRQSSQR